MPESISDFLLEDGRRLGNLKAVELKEHAEYLGLQKSGTKKDLCERIYKHLNENKAQQPEDPKPEPESTDHLDIEPLDFDENALKNEQTSGLDLNQSADDNIKSDGRTDNADENQPDEVVLPDSKVINDKLDKDNDKILPEVKQEAITPDVKTVPGARRRNWGNKVPEEPTSISTDTLENVIIKPVKIEKEEEKNDPISNLMCMQKDEEDYTEDTIETAPKIPDPIIKSYKDNQDTRTVIGVVSPPTRIEPFQPAKNPPSVLVYVRCLVRPFTLVQFKKLIESCFVSPEETWLDQVKSTAVIRFNDVDVATNCREGLDGCRWPSINPRVLKAEFVTEDLFEWLKKNGSGGDHLPPRDILYPSGKANDKLNKDQNEVHDKVPERMDDSALPKDPQKLPTEKKKTEEPSQTLDKLFKKTSNMPCIYWLPLSEEEAKKQAERRLAQHRSRIENTKKALEKRNRPSRSPFRGRRSRSGSRNKFSKRPRGRFERDSLSPMKRSR